jgi:hypothetical protein
MDFHVDRLIGFMLLRPGVEDGLQQTPTHEAASYRSKELTEERASLAPLIDLCCHILLHSIVHEL